MKAIFKIEEYFPETNSINIRFARLHAPKSIDEYPLNAISLDSLDLHDNETFIQTLMRNWGNRVVCEQEEEEKIINDTDVISDEFDIEKLIGKVVECKVEIDRREIIRMNKVEL